MEIMATKTTAKTKTANEPKPEETGFITELDQYLFGQGVHYGIYKKLGAHHVVKDGQEGIYFAVWAPNAGAVHLIGSFNGWDEGRNPMNRQDPLGIYDLFLPEAHLGDVYKFLIYTRDGRKLYKADPFANAAEFRPGTASVVTDISNLSWGDATWMRKQDKFEPETSPIAIYEVHPGSWMRHPHGEWDTGFYNYREFAHSCTEYVKKMGYTHVELMGIAEHPFDGSWGYQVTGYYAPTSRYGSPQDFAYMVDYFHKNNIGVILDWVPAHFPRDAHGLAEFDGTCVYEYADTRKGEHPNWGTKVFDYAKNEVKNFLIGNALFWVEHFHVDGLRVDAVASMLYLDYGRDYGQWVPNVYGGHENLEAIEFFKHLNSIMKKKHPGVMVIAEESTAWPKVTAAPEEDGLGFTMKWNMGWMHDFLEYMKLDPYFRKYNHNKMNFAMTYAYSEKYVLVLSHDEVVHLKCSMINKMPGYYDDKFANLKAGYSFMMGHPGKKLLFMGQDIAQFDEWWEERSIEWNLLQNEEHQNMQRYMKALLKLYKSSPALYQKDYDPQGFEWINCISANENMLVFLRKSEKEDEMLLVVCNFSPLCYEDHKIGVPFPGKYKEIFNSDRAEFGGGGNLNPRVKTSKKDECDEKPDSIRIKVPPMGISVFSCTRVEEKHSQNEAAKAKKSAAAKKTATAKTAAGKSTGAAAKKSTAKKNAPKRSLKEELEQKVAEEEK